MYDEQRYVKFLFKCESWLDKIIFFGYIVFKEGIFIDLKTLRLVSHKKGSQMLWRLKICLFHQVITDELWKDYLW